MRRDNEITMLKVHLDQAAQQRATLNSTLKEANHKVRYTRRPDEILVSYDGSCNPKPTDELSSRNNYV